MRDHERAVNDPERGHIEHVAAGLGAGQTVIDKIEIRLLHIVGMLCLVCEIAPERILERARMTERPHDTLEGIERQRDFRNARDGRIDLRRIARCRVSADDRNGGRDNRSVLVSTRDQPGTTEQNRDTTNECVLKILSLDHSSPVTRYGLKISIAQWTTCE